MSELRQTRHVYGEALLEAGKRFTDIAVLGFIGGFIVMMTLDVALG